MIALVAAFPVGVRQVDEAAAINNEPAGEEVDSIVESLFGDFDRFNMFCIAPGEVLMELVVPIEVEAFVLIAFEPNRAHAFFHLHCVHQRSRCSNPYTFRHFLPSRTLRVGDLMVDAEGADDAIGWDESVRWDGGLINIYFPGDPCKIENAWNVKIILCLLDILEILRRYV